MHTTVRSVDTTQLLKGVLDLAVLAVLKDEDGYGYDILRRLRAAGLDDVGDASVYGTLRRLFQAGLLTTYVVPSEAGPHRKYYALNAAGRDQLNRSGKTWRTFASTMDALLDGRGVAA
jgi:PadR family transcriptional regulator, regulatory protein PadR